MQNLFKIVKDEELEPDALVRIKICRECEHYKAFMCLKCKCFMPFKTRLHNTSCPIGKWIS